MGKEGKSNKVKNEEREREEEEEEEEEEAKSGRVPNYSPRALRDFLLPPVL